MSEDYDENDIAIVGMAIRVPGANNPEEYWQLLHDGEEQLVHYTDEELSERGVPASTLANPNYVKAGMPYQDLAQFDPEFFGFSPKEAAILDPQHRQFLEVAWEGLEDAGHPPSTFDGQVGVFAGCGMGAYFNFNILSNPALVDSVGLFLLRHTGNDKDFLSTRVSYSFNLRGPSISVQTACSTSLVATHLAAQSLLSLECDMAIAGGVTFEIPHHLGYLYQDGEILSPDGHCRPFDHKSKGTVFGSGAGVVVMRRLADALADSDCIHAVIKGSAVNNDGSSKVGYLAPSVEGQASAIVEALAVADVSADSIGLIECHGTGTPVGDPIEIAALTRAFRESTTRNEYCAVGSVKSNIGHLDTAAGVASLIKATLALKHKTIPPSLNFEAPNPEIDFATSPFYVASDLSPWERGETPRRAAINSLGVGGTNAFVILEESPVAEPIASAAKPEFLMLSGRSRKALDDNAERLADWLEAHPDASLSRVSQTLAVGRTAFEFGRVLAAESPVEAARLLREPNPRRVFNHTREVDKPFLAFLLPGGGAQYFAMSRDLYARYPTFAALIDKGLDWLDQHSDRDHRGIYFAADDAEEAVTEMLDQPSVQLPLTFVVEYALTQLWAEHGVTPDALIGHSMGENTAACVAGVMQFEDALGLVLLRGELFETTPAGGVLSVPLPAAELESMLPADLDLATSNSPGLSVTSGPPEALDAFAEKLSAEGLESQRVRVNVAAHSRLLDGILDAFRDRLSSMTLRPPEIPIVSNLTGAWLTDEQACDPDYWVAHLRNTVQFSAGIDTLLERDDCAFVEVGPGNTLASLVRQNPASPAQRILSSMRHPEDETPDDVYFAGAIGRLHSIGVDVDFERVWPVAQTKLSLPTYAFQHNHYWIDPGEVQAQSAADLERPQKIENTADWFYEPKWVQHGIIDTDDSPQTWLFFDNEEPVTAALMKRLEREGHTVLRVTPGDVFGQPDPSSFTLAPEAGLEGYDELIDALLRNNHLPDHIVHGWLITWDTSYRPGSSFFHRIQNHGFYSLFYLAKALGKRDITAPLSLTILTSDTQAVGNEAVAHPDKATAIGPAMVIPHEMPDVQCKLVDVRLGRATKQRRSNSDQNQDLTDLIDNLHEELLSEPSTELVAWRQGVRYTRSVVRRKQAANTTGLSLIRKGGVYLITGGFGGIAGVIGEWLAKEYGARIVLVSRTPLPSRDSWDEWIVDHGREDAISAAIERVRKLENLGAEVLPLAADVTVAEQVGAALQDIKQTFGEISGVFHTAGTIQDSLIAMKSQREIEDVFSAKVYGTLVLDAALSNEPLDFFTLFSSTSAFVAPQGQVDYVAANSFLNAFAESRRDTRRYPVIALNWGIWRDVGMVGHHHEAESTLSDQAEPAHPLFASHANGRDGMLEMHYLEGVLSTDDWIIDEHRLKNGDALLPGTGYIELIRAALQEAGNPAPWRIENLAFEQPLFVENGSERPFRVELIGNRGKWRAQVQARNGDTWQTCARAHVTRADDAREKDIDLAAIEHRCQDNVETAGGSAWLRTRQEDHLNFGSRWHVLRHSGFGDGEAYGKLRLEDALAREDLAQYALHPGMLDIATGFAMNLIPGYGDQEVAENLWVPISYGSFHYFKSLPDTVTAWVRYSPLSDPENGFASFDVSLLSDGGDLLAEIGQLTLRNTLGGFASHSTSNQETAKAPGELALEHNLQNGITPHEGVIAIQKVLTNPPPSEVIVSSLDVNELIAQSDSIANASAMSDDSSRFERPALDSEFESARDETEQQLAETWGKLLGVEGIGIHDSFFDLGGHSLIAVRLFNEIRERFDKDLPISALMQSPTIAALAEMIRGGAVGETSTAPTAEEPESQEREFLHVVPMHSNPVGGAIPLFMVAGMFGNVLNLSHLAHLLGEDRPFYALQARGLYGESEPHESFEEMATDYIAEMRVIQPEGPYLIGGYSGGGIIAYEIAQQLSQAGEEVVGVIMLDTPAPSFPNFSLLDKASMILQGIRANGLGHLVYKVQNRIQWEREQRENQNAEPIDQLSFQSQKVGDAFIRALRAYNVASLDVPVTVLRPKLNVKFQLSGGRMVDDERNLISEDNGWSSFVDKLTIIEVPGDHDSMVLEPNVRVLVSKIRNIIAVSPSSEKNAA